MPQDNPFQAPSNDELAMPLRTEYPGIGRLAYILLSIGMYFGTWALILFGLFGGVALTNSAAVGFLGFALALILGIGGSMWIVAQRLRNVGFSGWWCVATIIPIVNIYFGFMVVAAPQGYAHHRTLDTAGKILAGLFVGFLTLVVYTFVTAPYAPNP